MYWDETEGQNSSLTMTIHNET